MWPRHVGGVRIFWGFPCCSWLPTAKFKSLLSSCQFHPVLKRNSVCCVQWCPMFKFRQFIPRLVLARHEYLLFVIGSKLSCFFVFQWFVCWLATALYSPYVWGAWSRHKQRPSLYVSCCWSTSSVYYVWCESHSFTPFLSAGIGLCLQRSLVVERIMTYTKPFPYPFSSTRGTSKLLHGALAPLGSNSMLDFHDSPTWIWILQSHQRVDNGWSSPNHEQETPPDGATVERCPTWQLWSCPNQPRLLSYNTRIWASRE